MQPLAATRNKQLIIVETERESERRLSVKKSQIRCAAFVVSRFLYQHSILGIFTDI